MHHKPGFFLLAASVSFWTKDQFFSVLGNLLQPGAPHSQNSVVNESCWDSGQPSLQDPGFWGCKVFSWGLLFRFSGSSSCWERQQQTTLLALHLASYAEAHLYCSLLAINLCEVLLILRKVRWFSARPFLWFSSGDLTHKTHLQKGCYQFSVFFNRVGVDLDEDLKKEPSSHQASQRSQCIGCRDIRCSVPWNVLCLSNMWPRDSFQSGLPL